jgi:hypothetical protein
MVISVPRRTRPPAVGPPLSRRLKACPEVSVVSTVMARRRKDQSRLRRKSPDGQEVELSSARSGATSL